MKTNLSERNIRSFLNKENEPRSITVFDGIDSTNAYLKRNVRKDTETGTTVIADSQTNGRGRLGRTFYSPADTGMYMSVVFRAEDIGDISLITIAACTAACRALEDTAGVYPRIKWVNDIFLRGKKVCGILAESLTDPQTHRITHVIVGIGVNISTKDFPKDIRDIAGSVCEKGMSREKLAAEILNNLIPMCKNTADSDIIDYYGEHLMIVGKEVEYTLNGEERRGTVLGINEKGNLTVRTNDGGEDILKSGEISLGSKNFV